MPRVARIVIEGMPHHITQRGNNRQQVFFSDQDREFYLSLLKEKSERYGLEIHGYCLMTNHVHIIGTPSSADSLARAIGQTNWRLARRVNRAQHRSGHLWQNRFYSCSLDEWHYWRALRYIEQNPVRAHMVTLPWEHRWSSAAAHVGSEDSSDVLDVEKWRQSVTGADWKSTLLEALSEEAMKALRHHTQTGRPWMDDQSLEELEKKLGRSLRPRPAHRPRQEKTDAK